jgi:hypothetical protein
VFNPLLQIQKSHFLKLILTYFPNRLQDNPASFPSGKELGMFALAMGCYFFTNSIKTKGQAR